MVSLHRDRSGKGGLGCLASIIIVLLIVYFAARLLPPWIHYEQYRDQIISEARFATSIPDSVIRARLVAEADTLGLPAAAKRVVIRRRAGRPPTISIYADYFERVELPIFGFKLLHFHPKAEEPL